MDDLCLTVTTLLSFTEGLPKSQTTVNARLETTVGSTSRADFMQKAVIRQESARGVPPTIKIRR